MKQGFYQISYDTCNKLHGIALSSVHIFVMTVSSGYEQCVNLLCFNWLSASV